MMGDFVGRNAKSTSTRGASKPSNSRSRDTSPASSPA